MRALGDYDLQSQLGESRFSRLFSACHKHSGRAVLIKTLDIPKPSRSEIAKLNQEYETLKAITLEGVTEYVDLIIRDGVIAIVMEDFRGRQFTKTITQETLSLSTFLNVAARTARTLGNLHLRNVVHRSIRPQKILASEDFGHLKITDLGISIELSHELLDLYDSRVIEQTLLYMSPEQTGRMNRSVDSRTDIYSLGITFYEILTGQVPFSSKDPMELIHCHIAKEPRALTELDPEIPEIVSAIITKMMAKTTEARYQNCFGLAADLEHCAADLAETGKTSSFPVASKDISWKFNTPQLMVGRDAEVQQLLEAFERGASGSKEIVMVSGYPGIGKSLLIHDLQKAIVARRGYFLAGKYDQFRRDVHYSAIIQAFQGLIHQILTESDEMVAVWKEALLDAFGPNGRLITDVIPTVALVTGEQPAVTELGLEESQNRFLWVFRKFISVFCRGNHPITLFLDDLQWADTASFRLLREVISDPDLGYLVIIGAYRNNETRDTYQLTDLLKEARSNNIEVGEICLGPLAADDVTALIANFLRCDRCVAADLANLIHKKTGGNPFFVNQFLKSLHDRSHIVLDPAHGWQWDIKAVERLQVTDNVVDFMADNISTLCPTTVDTLKTCACIGNRFDLETVAALRNQPLDKTLALLSEAIAEELIYEKGDFYRFQHDRIQEAAYSLIPSDEKLNMHYRIAQQLLAGTPQDELESTSLFIIDHFNAALPLIQSIDEKLRVSGLNLMAGRKAKRAAAYDSAFHYFMSGLRLLVSDPLSPQEKHRPRDPKQDNDDLIFSLYLESMESSYLLRDYLTMDQLAAKALAIAKTQFQKGQVYEVQILALAAQGRVRESVRTARASLRSLGQRLPKSSSNLNLLCYFGLCRLILTSRSASQLKSIPETTDPLANTILKLFISSAPSLYLVKPKMMVVYIYFVVKNSLKYGIGSETIYMIMSYGVICIYAGLIETGYRYARMALDIMQQRKIFIKSASNYFVFNYFVSHWKNHFRSTIHGLQDAHDNALEQGDIEFAGYSIQACCNHMLVAGFALDDVEEKTQQYLKSFKTLKHKTVTTLLKLTAQVVDKLKYPSDEPSTLSGFAYVDEKDKRKSKQFIPQYIFMIMLSFLFERYDSGLEYSQLIAKRLFGFFGSFYIAYYYFYTLLTGCSIVGNASGRRRKDLWRQIKRNRKKLKKWARHAPANYGHKLDLVDAEIARLENRDFTALELYESAIAGAKENQYIQDEAIAYELTGRFWLGRNHEELGGFYFIKACDTYRRWGAMAKVDHIEERYGVLISAARISEHRPAGADYHRHDHVGLPSTVDVQSIAKTSRILSGEFELTRLLEKIMLISVENAGAEKGYLFLKDEQNKQLLLEAKGNVESVEVVQSTPMDELQELPMSIINYVHKTNDSVVLDNAMHDGRFLNDPYIRGNQSKSVLCSPIQNKGVMRGIVYLENNLTEGAFTPERLQVLQILSSQAAISIDNSRLLNHRENSARLETEFKIAQDIQTSLLPEIPNLADYEITAIMKPADEVGGDYYDFVSHDEGHWLVIGDVSGHGLPAGLVTMMVQSMIQCLLRTKPTISPSELLVGVNAALAYNVSRTKHAKYMTMTAFSFTNCGTIQYSGLHSDLFIYRSATKTVQVIESSGFWLGIFAADSADDYWEDFDLELDESDVLLLFTDGVTEAMLKGNETQKPNRSNMFGESRLRDILHRNGHLSTVQIKDAVLQELEGYDTADDVTLVVLKRTAKALVHKSGSAGDNGSV